MDEKEGIEIDVNKIEIHEAGWHERKEKKIRQIGKNLWRKKTQGRSKIISLNIFI